MMRDEELAWRVEEACLNACPAIRQVLFDGWLLRFSEGSRIRRNNSINPTRMALPASQERIAFCETMYRARGRPPLFRVPEIGAFGLDHALDPRGYGWEGESITLLADLGGARHPPDPEIVLSAQADAAWLAALSALQGQSQEERAAYARIVNLVTLPAIFASLRHEGKIVSAAFVVLQDSLAVLESVVTDRGQRGKGLARRMLTAALAAAKARGAFSACLQVQADNTPAIALYAKLGFDTELYLENLAMRAPQAKLHYGSTAFWHRRPTAAPVAARQSLSPGPASCRSFCLD
jgi:N-acetylglutamate synthase